MQTVSLGTPSLSASENAAPRTRVSGGASDLVIMICLAGRSTPAVHTRSEKNPPWCRSDPSKGATMPPGGVRASDAERDVTIERLSRAFGQGRLSMEELDERVTAAQAATTRDELADLTSDLPGRLW